MIAQDKIRNFRGEWPPATDAPSRMPLVPHTRPDRTVALLALSERIPDRFIAEALAQSLRAETGGSVLLIHLDRPERLREGFGNKTVGNPL